MKLSIITINLNNAEGLQKTIESVVSQTFTDYEYIIIDGGSTDESVELIKQWAGKISYWVSEKDHGIYNAMNKGIRAAKGEYCQFLNSGDVLYSKEVLANVFSTNYPEEIITGSFREISQGNIKLDKGLAYYRDKEEREITLFDMFVGTLLHQATFIKRTLFDQYGLYDETYTVVSDWIFFLKTIGLNGIKVKYIDVVVVDYGADGISSVNLPLLQKERKEALEKIIPPSILEDYKQYQKMNKELKPARNLFKYKISKYICGVLNRLILLYEGIMKKEKNGKK